MVWVIVILIVVSGFVYVVIRKSVEKNVLPVTVQETAPGEEKLPVPPVMLQGTVTGVSPEKLEITVSADAVEKTVKISPTTRIEKVISQKNTDGTVGKQALIEVNMADVQKSLEVTVIYAFEETPVLRGVSRVTFKVEPENIDLDTYLKSEFEHSPNLYLKGEVVSVDLVANKIQFKPHLFGTSATTTYSVALPTDIPVYRVDDLLRAPILHARIPATLSDIQPGQMVSFMVDNKPLKIDSIIPLAVIVSVK